MEREAEELLLLTLRLALGPPDIPNVPLAEMNSATVVAITGRCLQLIDGSEQQSIKGLKSVAARHRLCTTLAEKVKLTIHYDCGYGAFLYPGEQSTRRLLTALTEKLPTKGKEAEKGDFLIAAVRRECAHNWRLPVVLDKQHRLRTCCLDVNGPLVTSQCAQGVSFALSVLELAHREFDDEEQELDAEPATPVSLAPVAPVPVSLAIVAPVAEFGHARETVLLKEPEKLRRVEIARAKAASLLAQFTAEAVDLERDAALSRRAAAMLPGTLEAAIEAAKRRRVDLEAEWAAFKEPLEAALEQRRAGKKSARAMIREVKQAKVQHQQMALQVREREERAALLENEFSAMPPAAANRTLYTRRIMAVINSIAEQKAELAVVITSIRTLQKENNKVSESLQRAAALADERVFQGAKDGDQAASAAYRHLADLRRLFESTVQLVSETGAKDRATLVLQSKHKQLKSRLSASSVAAVLRDLATVKLENAEIQRKLQS